MDILEASVRFLGPELLEAQGLDPLDRPQLSATLRRRHKPLQQLPFLHQRLPLVQVPVHVPEGVVVQAGFPAEQHDHPAGGGHETQEEDVPRSAIVAF